MNHMPLTTDAVNRQLATLADVIDQHRVHGTMREFKHPDGIEAAKKYDFLMDFKLRINGLKR